jgi:hypothetical protein
MTLLRARSEPFYRGDRDGSKPKTGQPGKTMDITASIDTDDFGHDEALLCLVGTVVARARRTGSPRLRNFLYDASCQATNRAQGGAL